jgi:hypothetical protein
MAPSQSHEAVFLQTEDPTEKYLEENVIHTCTDAPPGHQDSYNMIGNV